MSALRYALLGSFPQFESLWARAETVPLGSTTARVARIDDLIAMKWRAGCAKDLADIEALEAIRHETRSGAR